MSHFLAPVVLGISMVAMVLPPPDDSGNSKAKTVRIGHITWYTDYDEAMRIAKQRKQPMWLHFGENPG